MKLLISIMSSRNNTRRQENILDTWGKEVDIMFYSDHLDEEKNIIKVSDRTDYHSNEEKHINALNYILQNKKDYDWYFFCDDDTYVNVSNLKKFIESADETKVHGFKISYKKCPDNPIYEIIPKNIEYLSGGAGYLIFKDTLFSYNEFINHDKGYSDVSFGINIHNKTKIEDSNLFHSQPPEFYNHNFLQKREMVTYHYIKELPQILNLL